MLALGDEDISGLDVAVNDPLGVRGIEGVGNLDGDGKKLVPFQRTPLDHVLEGHAIEKLHHHEGAAIFFADVVDRTDVGMVERRSGARLPAEALQRLWVTRHLIGKELEGDEPAEARVLGFVHHAHAAAPEFIDNAVVGDDLADH